MVLVSGPAVSTHELPLADFWPGAVHVQIVGADAYNWGTPWMSLSQTFRGPAGWSDYIFDTYSEIMALDGAAGLPFWIGETGTVDAGKPGSAGPCGGNRR